MMDNKINFNKAALDGRRFFSSAPGSAEMSWQD